MDQETEEQAMRRMMGFSSFGPQDRPQKKRKYNPNADATAHIQSQASTGSNTTPLGSQVRDPGNVASNMDEIDLDDDDGKDGGAPAASAEQGGAASSEPTHTLPQGLPQRPAPGPGFTNPSGRPGPGQGQHGKLSQSSDTQGAPWWEGYYDSLSNRNPWDKLEKSMGLQPRGTWVSHEGRTTSST